MTSASASSRRHTHWLPHRQQQDDGSDIIVDALCLGTGRFLRSVLVPALVGAGFRPALIQPRGDSFVRYMHDNNSSSSSPNNGCYEVDTVLENGEIQTDEIPCYGAFSLGRPKDEKAFQDFLRGLNQGISIIGLGVTEAGLSSKDTKVMKDLYGLLKLMMSLIEDGKWDQTPRKICVIDMDNVPNNGDLIAKYMVEIATASSDDGGDDDTVKMKKFLTTRVVFLNTMVDRITSQRPGSDGLVPRCEPTPAKALVILDPQEDLPKSDSFSNQPGVVIRSTQEQLSIDINLKLRVANGTHTAIAHTLALLRHNQTDILAPNDATPSSILFMKYLDALVSDQIIPAACKITTKHEAVAVWKDWRQRLIHPHFGLSSFFITQNGPAKGGIRFGPTVVDLLSNADGDNSQMTTVSLVFAYASLLRWLTPIPCETSYSSTSDNVFVGWLDGFSAEDIVKARSLDTENAVVYADGLRHNHEQGWYEFKCSLCVPSDDGQVDSTIPLTRLLKSCIGQQPDGCINAVKAYMMASQGGDLSSVRSAHGLQALINAVAVIYSRMVSGDSLLTILEELDKKSFSTPSSDISDGLSSQQCDSGVPLFYKIASVPDSSSLMKLIVAADSIKSVVLSEVASMELIDIHTHLLPPTHGALCLWGIDELLTYHYLVAEYFMTAPAKIYPEEFYGKTKQEQADVIWKSLFCDRVPLSEACRGIITTLISLGLEKEVRSRDLDAIRSFYKAFRIRGEVGAIEFTEKLFSSAGVRYAIMTNIPFDSNEAHYWLSKIKFSARFRSALRIDPLLAGDTAAVMRSLIAAGYESTLDGARQYLNDWIDTMKPEYLMASTPHDFVLREGSLSDANNTGVNMDNMVEPFAFVAATKAAYAAGCDGTEDDTPTVINEDSDLLSEVLMKVCEDRDLPIALKIGAHRGINPQLKAAGDGMVYANSAVLCRLCTRYPKIRFLCTFLSRNNQHEACVLANKFRNLHIYGCWWYCNNPSIIREITTMRIEMLGTAFTAQHSDARVMDQLLYKWPHSRSIIASVLSEEMKKLVDSGWAPTREEIRREVRRLFGGSYEEFMAKSLK